MIFAQFTNQPSLKSIESSLLANSTCMYHLGISKTSKSTIAYANENRDYRVYEHLFYELYSKVKAIAPKHRFRFKNKLSSVDATTIDLCNATFPWAKFRKSKSGVKLVLKLDHNGYIPEQATLTNAICHEKTSVNYSWFDKDEIIAFDKGFSDYKFFANLYNNGIYFVTRLKKNAQYEVISEISSKHENILSEKIISFTGYYSKKKCPMKLRMIESHDPDTDKTITLITNHFSLSPDTIAKIYKERWQIEIFFKMMKQYLKIKRYYGNSRNAVYTQIYIALISFLLLTYLKFTTKCRIPMSRIISILRLNIFLKRDLLHILEIIEKPPPGRCSIKSCQGVLF
jgi:putative transposase